MFVPQASCSTGRQVCLFAIGCRVTVALVPLGSLQLFVTYHIPTRTGHDTAEFKSHHEEPPNAKEMIRPIYTDRSNFNLCKNKQGLPWPPHPSSTAHHHHPINQSIEQPKNHQVFKPNLSSQLSQNY